MNLIINNSTDPAFNLALEEYLLAGTNLDAIMLWRNYKAAIIGKNQNALEEIDVDYIKKHNIPVIRRQSGGGAVFHDLGNMNFTIINKAGGGDFSDYEKFTSPIIDFLHELGVCAELRGRNDLVIGGMKFSGNAQAVKNGRIMHHGTILYNADFGDLAGALKPNEAKIESKGIKSVRSRVTNVAAHLLAPMPAEDFFHKLCDYFLNNTKDIAEYTLTDADIKATNLLKDEKYSRWEHNFGKSPDYTYEKSVKLPAGFIDVRIFAANGIIEDVKIYGDFFGELDVSDLESRLKGIKHERPAVENAIRDLPLQKYIYGINPEEFTSLF